MRHFRTGLEAGEEAAIQHHIRPLNAVLAALEPLEAIVLLGNLAVDTIARFPPAERMQLADGWAKTFREGVRDGLRGAR